MDGSEQWAVDCTDASGRPRQTRLSITERDQVCVTTPPGEIACFDWFQLDQLIEGLTDLRRRHRGH